MIGYIVGTNWHYDGTEFEQPARVYMDRVDADEAAKALNGSGCTGEVVEIEIPAVWGVNTRLLECRCDDPDDNGAGGCPNCGGYIEDK